MTRRRSQTHTQQRTERDYTMIILPDRRYTIRFARTEPADCPVHGSIVTCDMSLECPGHLKIGWKGFTARSIFEPILPPELCDYPIRAQQTPKTTFTLCDCERETGGVSQCTYMHPSCFEIFSYLSTWNSFVESIISNEMHCQICWIVASMVLLDSKNIAYAIVCACKELLRNLSE